MLWWDEINVLYDRLQINRIIRKYFVLCQNRHTYSWQLQPLGFESRASKKSVCFFLQSHFIERWKETTAIWMIPFFLPNSFSHRKKTVEWLVLPVFQSFKRKKLWSYFFLDTCWKKQWNFMIFYYNNKINTFYHLYVLYLAFHQHPYIWWCFMPHLFVAERKAVFQVKLFYFCSLHRGWII